MDGAGYEHKGGGDGNGLAFWPWADEEQFFWAETPVMRAPKEHAMPRR